MPLERDKTLPILISNDDGVGARGIQLLAEAAEPFGDVYISAPAEEASASSHAITLRSPLRVNRVAEKTLAVGGTPTDSIYLALHHFCPQKPALVLSGINKGANLGLDVLYSGTVAAAMEAVRYDIPALAISLATPSPTEKNWQVAKEIARELIRWFVEKWPVSPPKLLNVNIPPAERTDLPWKVTRLGNVEYPIQIEKRDDPWGVPYYWIGGYPPKYDSEVGTDCWAVQQGFVSITPLKLDMTAHDEVENLSKIVGDHDRKT